MRRLARVAGALLVGGLALSVTLDARAVADSARSLLGGDDNRVPRTTKLVNQGKGPALQLRSRGRSPALAVSNSRLVKRLNADQVDGLDAADLAPVTTRFVVARPGDSLRPHKALRVSLPAGNYLMTGSGALRAENDNTSWACFAGDPAVLTSADTSGVLAVDMGRGPGGPNLSDVVTVGSRPLAVGCTVEGEHEVIVPFEFTFRPVGEIVTGQGQPVE